MFILRSNIWVLCSDGMEVSEWMWNWYWVGESKPAATFNLDQPKRMSQCPPQKKISGGDCEELWHTKSINLSEFVSEAFTSQSIYFILVVSDMRNLICKVKKRCSFRRFLFWLNRVTKKIHVGFVDMGLKKKLREQ